MNKIEELERRIKALEEVLGIEPEQPSYVSSWNDDTETCKPQEAYSTRVTEVVYRCDKGHDHTSSTEALICDRHTK